MKQTANGTILLADDHPRDYRWLAGVLADATQAVPDGAAIGIDVETKTKRGKRPNPRSDPLVGVGIAVAPAGDGEALPIYAVATDALLQVFKQHLPSLPWYAFNAMFDATSLRCNGVKLGEHVGDARIIAYLLGEPDAALKPLLQRWLQYETQEYDQLLDEYEAEDITGVPVEVQADYCALQDAAQCMRLERLMREELSERVADVYTGIELPMVNVLVEMSDVGIRFDRELGQEMYDSDREKREQLDSLIARLVGLTGFKQWEKRQGQVWYPTCKSCRNGSKKREGCLACKGRGKLDAVLKPFNPGSDQQVRDWLYGHMRAPVRRYTGGKSDWQVRQDRYNGVESDPATDRLALLQLKEFHEVIPLLLARGKLAKREGYESKWLELSLADGRLHTTFTNTRVVSGRLSSREPNLTQVTQDLRVLMTADP